jgi:branched-chain amino acid transport system ATP-binding protein
MALLETRGLTAFYGDFQALYGIDMRLQAGETIAVIGANGAGKSTFLKAIAGLLAGPAASVVFDGEPIGHRDAADIMRRGIALVPEGRRLFPSLSLEENLLIGQYGRAVKGPWSLAAVYDLFPTLRERRQVPSSLLSGGEQQMAAIGRALMSNPRLLLCDEISLGLAPRVVADIYAALPRIKDSGASVILVEQDIVQALRVASRVYCFQEGRLSLAGRPDELTTEQIRAAYFGT